MFLIMELAHLVKIAKIKSVKYIVLLIFFIGIKGISQDINKIKNGNVLFVYFEKDNETFKKMTLSVNKKDRAKSTSFYSYYFDKNRKKDSQEKLCFWLRFNEYEDFDEKRKDIPNLFFKINKSFLRKNKSIIITNEFINKIGYAQISTMLKNAKKILLIDKDDIENNLIVVKEVTYSTEPIE